MTEELKPAHAKLSPSSSSDRWLACPASIAEQLADDRAPATVGGEVAVAVTTQTADLAIMVDEMKKQKALIDQLGEVLIDMWPHFEATDFTSFIRVRNALHAYRASSGAPATLLPLNIGDYNPWKDEIVIEGKAYTGDFFRNNERAQLAKDAARYRHMRANAVFQHRNGPGLYWYLPRTPDIRGLSEGEALDVNIDANMKRN